MKKLLLLTLLLASFNVSALTVNLSWLPPTERENGDALPEADIAGYNVYYTSTKSGDYINSVFVSGGNTNAYKLLMPDATKYFIVVTTVDTDGRESSYSKEVSKEYAKPSKPTFTFGAIETPDYASAEQIEW